MKNDLLNRLKTAGSVAFKQCDFECKSSDNGMLSGYLSTFGNIDLDGDTFSKGAFVGSIGSGRFENGQIPLLKRHFALGGDTEDVIGSVKSAMEDDRGLYIAAEFSAAQSAQEIRQKIVEGHLKTMSIGFRPIKWEMMQNGGADFKEVKVIEATVTPLPANESARIQSAKSETIGNIIDAMEVENLPSAKAMIQYLLELAKAANDTEARDYEDLAAKYRRALKLAKAQEVTRIIRDWR